MVRFFVTGVIASPLFFLGFVFPIFFLTWIGFWFLLYNITAKR